jgi:hypothetical protein
MPIYFSLFIGVLLSVGREPTPQAYFERGALWYSRRHADKIGIGAAVIRNRDSGSGGDSSIALLSRNPRGRAGAAERSLPGGEPALSQCLTSNPHAITSAGVTVQSRNFWIPCWPHCWTKPPFNGLELSRGAAPARSLLTYLYGLSRWYAREIFGCRFLPAARPVAHQNRNLIAN